MNHRNGRQREDGGWPSGNKSGNRKTTGRIPNNQPKLDSKPMTCATTPPDPRESSQVRSSPAKNESAVMNEPYRSRPPITFRRSRLTMRAPTTPNIEKATTNGSCSPRTSSLMTTRIMPTKAIATNVAKTAHGHRAG